MWPSYTSALKAIGRHQASRTHRRFARSSGGALNVIRIRSCQSRGRKSGSQPDTYPSRQMDQGLIHKKTAFSQSRSRRVERASTAIRPFATKSTSIAVTQRLVHARQRRSSNPRVAPDACAPGR